MWNQLRTLSGSQLYTIPSTSNFLSLELAWRMLLADLLLGVFGYMLTEGYNLIDAIYMVIITISTVGYTEVEPLSPLGKKFSSFFILINIGLFAYFLAVFSYYIIQGEIFKRMHADLINQSIKNAGSRHPLRLWKIRQ